METVANNKLIAEFLGMETMTRTPNGWEVAKFNFNNSWDSLMLAVDKIENLGYVFEIKKTWCKIKDDKNIIALRWEEDDSKINAAYNATLQFIRNYNANK